MKSVYLRVTQYGKPVETATVFASDSKGKASENKAPEYTDEDGYIIVDVPNETTNLTARFMGAMTTIQMPTDLSGTILIELPASTGTDLNEVEIKAKKTPKKNWLEDNLLIVTVVFALIIGGIIVYKKMN